MSEAVIWEMQFLAVIVTLGIGGAFFYDFLRIFRRLIPHGTFWIALEDIAFWAACGMVIFVVSFWENDGRLRWYTVVGVATGAFLYHGTVGNWWVLTMTRLLKIPLKVLKKALKVCCNSYKMIRDRKGEGCDGGKEKKEKSV